MFSLTPGQVTELEVETSSDTRLDVYLATSIENLSRTAAQKLIDEEHVKVNGICEPSRYKVQVGDKIQVRLPSLKPSTLSAQEIPLTILYQDEHLAVIDKPAGLVVHPAVGHEDGTLVNALLHHLKDLSTGSGVGGELRPGIVHRIDRNTSGVLLVTKTDPAHSALSQQFKEHSISRKYLGLCWGKLPDSGEFTGAIGRDPRERKRMAIVEEGGRHAITRYKALERFGDGLTFFEAELLTGRTHQIRVHFAAHGFPLAGDSTYFGAYRSARNKRDAGLKALRRSCAGMIPPLEKLDEEGRQFLHAGFLAFTHPAHGKRLEYRSEMPTDLTSIMEGLRKCLF